MSIFIKGMEKPSDCQYCVMYRDGYCGAKGGFCCSEKGVDDDCPLVEVKTPHGRLIDRDTLMEGLKPRWDCMDDHDFADKGVWQALEETPILVEAEPDEDCQTCKNYNTEKCNMCGIEADYYEAEVE